MNTAVCLLGLCCCALLFFRFRTLRVYEGPQNGDISVIIPARNEAQNLPLLLGDLQKQTLAPKEVICVDDASEDDTGPVARLHGAKVVTVANKPDGWTGKSYACQLGAQQALGKTLLFLDADVRLAPQALQTLAHRHESTGKTISVQPYHTTVRWVEQLSFFFNLIVAAALGSPLPFGGRAKGLFGPVIAISAADYNLCGGHAGVRGNVLEDIELGRALDKQSLPYECLLGGRLITFRMYAGGLTPLVEGWTKNFAAGAMGSSPVFIIAISLWIASMCIIPARLIAALAASWWMGLALYSALYLLMAALLGYGSHRVGRFKALTVLVYPVSLLFFLAIFLLSLYKKILRRPVRWKGRNILEE